MFRNFHLDVLSFVIGFIGASLFWWLVSRLRPLLPGIGENLRKFFQTLRQRNLEGADLYLRRDALRRAQKNHLTAAIFALDEILVPPQLLAPPVAVEPDQPPPQEAVATQIIPYMPDWPELAAGHGATVFNLSDALQAGSNIAVIGQPGSGKTVALADLASRLARIDPTLGSITKNLPIYLHVLDLTSDKEQNPDPVAVILKALIPHVTVIYQPQMARLVRDCLREGQAVFILDGLDELHPSELPSVSEFLKSFIEKFPGVRVVIAASPYFLDGLMELGFVPLGIAAWGAARREEFLDRWSQAWAAHIQPEIDKHQTLVPVSPHLIDNWLRGERGFPSPLEWTLKVWGAYAGDLQPAPFSPLETLLSRFASGISSRDALRVLGREYIIRGRAALPYGDLDKLLTSLTPSSPVFVEETPSQPDESAAEEKDLKARQGQKGKRDIILSIGEQILETLVRGGVLVEHPDSLIRFANPAICGYFASQGLSIEDIAISLQSPFWAHANQGLRYLSARSEEAGWVETFLRSEETPLHRPLLAVSRWLAEGKPNAAWRGSIFRHLLDGMQNDLLPFSLRARMTAAFVFSNDPSVPKLFKQLTTARTPSVRLLATLGIGALGDSSLAGDLIGLLKDFEESVRKAACLGLVALHSDSALSAAADVLLNGDEGLRQTAAESLVHLPDQGFEIIREAAKVSDLLTRRAAVFGLMQIHETWSKEMLEKMAVEDAQWVVRNAAAQALETLQENDRRIPRPLPPPHEAPWLVSFAGKRNLGLSPYQPATDVLLMALKSGTIEDQIAALKYLKDTPEEHVISAVYAVYYGDQPELKEAALLVVWQWALAGVNLPEPMKIGIS
jgi:HEAT repeat protein